MNAVLRPGCWGHAVTYDGRDPICASCMHRETCAVSAAERRERLEKLLAYRSEYSDVPTLVSARIASDASRSVRADSAVLSEAEDEGLTEIKGIAAEETSAFFLAPDTHSKLSYSGIDFENDKGSVRSPSVSEPSEPRVAVKGAMSKKALELADRLKRKGIDLKSELKGANSVGGAGEGLGARIPEFLWHACVSLLAMKRLDRTALATKFREVLGWSGGTASSHVSIVISLFRGLNIVNVDGDATLD